MKEQRMNIKESFNLLGKFNGMILSEQLGLNEIVEPVLKCKRGEIKSYIKREFYKEDNTPSDLFIEFLTLPSKALGCMMLMKKSTKHTSPETFVGGYDKFSDYRKWMVEISKNMNSEEVSKYTKEDLFESFIGGFISGGVYTSNLYKEHVNNKRLRK